MIPAKQIQFSNELAPEYCQAISKHIPDRVFKFDFYPENLMITLEGTIKVVDDFVVLKKVGEEKAQHIIYFNEIMRVYVNTFDVSKLLNKFVEVEYLESDKSDRLTTVRGVVSHFDSSYDSITVAPEGHLTKGELILSVLIKDIKEVLWVNQFDNLKKGETCRVKLLEEEVDVIFDKTCVSPDNKDSEIVKSVCLYVRADKLQLMKKEEPKNKSGEMIYKRDLFGQGKEVKHGLHITYGEDGKTKLLEMNYNFGKLDGKYFVYHPNGKVKCEYCYKDDVAIGKGLIYNEDGLLVKVYTYKDGKEFQISFYQDRIEVPFEQYRNYKTTIETNPQDGRIVTFTIDDEKIGDSICKRQITTKQEKIGDCIYKKQIIFQNGKEVDHGLQIIYGKDGVSKISEANYDFGKRHGECIGYSPNGKAQSITTFDHDVRLTCKEFNENGSLVCSTIYKDDEVSEVSNYDNGKTLLYVNYEKSLKTKYSWSKNNFLLKEENFYYSNKNNINNGTYNGKVIQYVADKYPQKDYETTYVFGKKNGLEIHYYQDGNVRSEINFENGIVKTTTQYQLNKYKSYIVYQSNEHLLSFQQWDNNGKEHGYHRFYYKDGSIKSEYEYDHGMLKYSKNYYQNKALSLSDFTTYQNGKEVERLEYNEDCSLKHRISFDENGNISGGKSPFNDILEKISNITDLTLFVTTKKRNVLTKALAKYVDKKEFVEIHDLIHNDLHNSMCKRHYTTDCMKVIIEFMKYSIEYCELVKDETRKKNITEFIEKVQKKLDELQNGPDFIKSLFNQSSINRTKYHKDPVISHLISNQVENIKTKQQASSKIEDYINKEVKVKYGNKDRNIFVTEVYTNGTTKYALVKDIIDGVQYIKTFIVDKITILN